MADEILDEDALWEMYSPKPNPWFESSFTYEGWGVATFENPAGTIEGPTKIIVDETGKFTTEMEIQKLNTPITIYGIGNLKYIKFIQGIIGSKETENIGYGNVNTFNPCSQLIVQTTAGIFKSSGNIYCRADELNRSNKCDFFLSEGAYEVKQPNSPKYWAIPLVNFISTFRPTNQPELIFHPLRIFKTPNVTVPDNDKHKQVAFSASFGKNLLISFNFGKKNGYIQPVLDYNEKEQALKTGEIHQSITALMISEVTDDLENVQFPYDYTNLLSFALGNKISALWVEFRDDNGILISRKHITQASVDFAKGYAALNEIFYRGLGNLISLASNSYEFKESYFRVLISHLVRSQSYFRQMEDRMDILCRTFDTLCEKFGYDVQNLISHFPENYQTEIKEILQDAYQKIKALPSKIDKSSRKDLSPTLQRVADKTISAYLKDRHFGLAVRDMLKNKYNMPDVAIMEKYYAENKIAEKFWEQTLTKYRGAVIHTGYFANEKYTSQDIMQLQDHLHDILVRLVFKILGYEGKYQSPITKHWGNSKMVDWVDENTPASELGYKHPIV